MKTKKMVAIITSLTMLSGVSALPIHAAYEGSSVFADEFVAKLNRIGALEVRWASMDYVDDSEIMDEWTHIGDYTIDDPLAYQKAPNISYFDLRNVDGKNYVTPVKAQNPFGTCWAFAATAAAESSIAYELGIDMNTADDETKKALDFSERHLAWLSYSFLPKNSFYASQAGEGVTPYRCRNFDAERYKTDADYAYDYNMKLMGFGGKEVSAITMYSSKQGPVLESVVPYHNNANEYSGLVYMLNFVKDPQYMDILDYEELCMYVTQESLEPIYYGSLDELNALYAKANGVFDYKVEGWYAGKGYYMYMPDFPEPNAGGYWAIDEEDRFQGLYTPERLCVLPSPCTSNENDEYQFDYRGLNAIKHELINGRAVTISFHADQSSPDEQDDSTQYLQFWDKNWNRTTSNDDALYWCHYTYDETYDPNDPSSINEQINANHAVTIVGYVDEFPKEAFYDPNGTIGGDGAFIAKNSWGTNWGDQGYFYISYYDQSLRTPMSFDFAVDPSKGVSTESDKSSKIYMYDMKPALDYIAFEYDHKVSMANVYTAEEDAQITALGYTSVTSNETVYYEFYLLDDNAADPTDGVCAASGSVLHGFAGYQQSEIDVPVSVKKGQRFSVIVTTQTESGKYNISLNKDFSEKGCDKVADLLEQNISTFDMDYDSQQEMLDGYINDLAFGRSVVNQGESYIGANNQWADWSDILKKSYANQSGENMDYDNFSIRAVTVADTNQESSGHLTLGDVNQDGEVNIMDVIRLNKSLLGIEMLEDTESQVADVDGNGQTDANDSLMILKYVLEIISGFPVK